MLRLGGTFGHGSCRCPRVVLLIIKNKRWSTTNESVYSRFLERIPFPIGLPLFGPLYVRLTNGCLFRGCSCWLVSKGDQQENQPYVWCLLKRDTPKSLKPANRLSARGSHSICRRLVPNVDLSIGPKPFSLEQRPFKIQQAILVGASVPAWINNILWMDTTHPAMMIPPQIPRNHGFF